MAEILRARLDRKPIVVAPGVYDAFTALTATQAGFETLYVSGAAIAYTRLGRPDIGLVAMSEVAETITLIRDRVGAHLIVDADTGYGNALNVMRTVRAFERAGATAIQREAGADILFVEAPKTRDELARVVTALPGVPLMANMVEGGKTPPLAASELEAIGFALVIFPGGIVRAIAHHAAGYYGSLAANGTTEPFRNQMLDFDGLNRVIGTPEMIALGKQYESK
jgi:2-methylisocitrate lyase-like PEP mutase family enzyme